MSKNESKAPTSITLSIPADVAAVFPEWGEPNTPERAWCFNFISLLAEGFPAGKIHAMKAVLMNPKAPKPPANVMEMDTETYAALTLNLLATRFGK